MPMPFPILDVVRPGEAGTVSGGRLKNESATGVPDIQKRPKFLLRTLLKMACRLKTEKGQKNAAPTIAGTAPLVDDKGLEPLTSRTSSGCATSCANRPCQNDKGYYIRFSLKMQGIFEKF